jgi:hypothetical protein
VKSYLPVQAVFHRQRSVDASTQGLWCYSTTLGIGRATRVQPALAARTLKAYLTKNTTSIFLFYERGVDSGRGMPKSVYPREGSVQLDGALSDIVPLEEKQGNHHEITQKGRTKKKGTRSLCSVTEWEMMCLFCRPPQPPFFASSFDFISYLLHDAACLVFCTASLSPIYVM